MSHVIACGNVLCLSLLVGVPLTLMIVGAVSYGVGMSMKCEAATCTPISRTHCITHGCPAQPFTIPLANGTDPTTNKTMTFSVYRDHPCSHGCEDQKTHLTRDSLVFICIGGLIILAIVIVTIIIYTLECGVCKVYPQPQPQEEPQQVQVVVLPALTVPTHLTHHMCSICLEAMDLSNEKHHLAETQCKHAYHHDCITAWLKVKSTCPNCAAPL